MGDAHQHHISTAIQSQLVISLGRLSTTASNIYYYDRASENMYAKNATETYGCHSGGGIHQPARDLTQ